MPRLFGPEAKGISMSLGSSSSLWPWASAKTPYLLYFAEPVPIYAPSKLIITASFVRFITL